MDDLFKKLVDTREEYNKSIEEVYKALIGKVIVKKKEHTNGCSCSFLMKEGEDETNRLSPADPLEKRIKLEHYKMCDTCKALAQKGTSLRDIINAIANGIGEISVMDSIKAGEEK